jgi:hypothetical protein
MKVSATNVTLGEMNNSQAWSHVLSGAGGMGYQGQTGGTLGSTALYTNNLAPTAGVAMTNTTAALGSGLGGQFSALPTLAVNNDGIITISDVYYIYMKKSGRFSTWGGSLPNTRLFTQSQYNIINSSTSDLRSTYPGTSSITISTPTSGGSSSYYLINTGYSNSSILSY